MPARTQRPAATWIGLACLLAFGIPAVAQVTGQEPVVGGPCEGCEAVFQGIPEEIPSRSRIAPTDEPGEPLRITGTVTHEDGAPAPGIVVYAYHTDDEGIYPPNEEFPGQAAYRHGELRAWAETDDRGRYRFDTIRPAGYPGSSVAQHVHMHVIEPGHCTYYLDSIHFTDDPRLTPSRRRGADDGRGGSGVVTPHRSDAGVWVVERDIVLGRNVPGYGACGTDQTPRGSRLR